MDMDVAVELKLPAVSEVLTVFTAFQLLPDLRCRVTVDPLGDLVTLPLKVKVVLVSNDAGTVSEMDREVAASAGETVTTANAHAAATAILKTLMAGAPLAEPSTPRLLHGTPVFPGKDANHPSFEQDLRSHLHRRPTSLTGMATHEADSHDLIRVHGARENNLQNVDIELPKRRLTVFTGVSGSGKSSLVFETIAAESRRLINETYSAFVQGFMGSQGRPDVDVLDGLTTAIVVDQERMGANARSTVGTVTDANAMLRLLFSRLGEPYIGPAVAFSFNVPTRTASGVMTSATGEKQVVRNAVYHGGMCANCEGRGTVSDIDLSQVFDESKSLNEGAILVPGYTADGWMVRQFAESGFVDGDKPINKYTKQEREDFLYKESTKVKIAKMNLTYEGLIPKIQKSMLSKDVDALQPHIRAFVQKIATFAPCPECGGTRLNEGARSSKINSKNIADLCSMQITDLAAWIRDVKKPGAAPLLKALGENLDSVV